MSQEADPPSPTPLLTENMVERNAFSNHHRLNRSKERVRTTIHPAHESSRRPNL